MSKATVIDSEDTLNAYIEHLKTQFDKHGSLNISLATGKKRTLTQNASLHKYCDMVAIALNDAGLDMNVVLAEGTSIAWSETKVKEDIWHKVQLALTGKKSSADLDRMEVSKVYDTINRHLSSTFGVFIPWPSKPNN